MSFPRARPDNVVKWPVKVEKLKRRRSIDGFELIFEFHIHVYISTKTLLLILENNEISIQSR